MKLNKKLSFLAVTALAAVTALTSSCSDDKYWDEDGISGQGVTFDRKSMSAIYKPGDEIPSPVFNVVIRRGSTSGTETVTVAGYTADSDGAYTVPVTASDPWTFATTASFADGSNEAVIPVTLTTTAEGTYKMALKIESTSSLALGANSSVILSVSISAGDPQPIWRTLGKGQLTNDIFVLPSGSAEVQVDDAEWPEGSKGYYGHYRIYHPYEYLMDEGETYEEYIAAGWPEAIEFYICPPGYSTTFWDKDNTNSEGINFSWGEDQTLTLALMKTYTLPIDLFGAGDAYDSFVSPIYFTVFDQDPANQQAISVIDGWVQEPNYDATPGTDEFRGIPNAVGMGALILRENTTSGTTGYINYKTFNFVFPGGSLGDYSFELAYFGHTFNADKTKEYLSAEITATGTDCRGFVVGLVQTNSSSTAAEALQEYWEARQESDDPDAMPLPEGMYGYTEATITEGNSQSFMYEVPQESANYTFVAFSLNEGAIAETSAVGVKFQSITEMGGDDANWEDLGMGQMTDGMLLEQYFQGGIIPDQYIVAYDVPVQKHKTEAGQYRVVTPYSAEYFPIGGLNDFVPGDENMLIDASNPACVKIPEFVAGTWPDYDQTFVLMSSSYYYSSTGISDQAIINSGIAGTLQDGVISFPAAISDASGTLPSMLSMIPEESSSSLYVANRQGLFNVVLPDAAQSARKVAAKSAKNFKQLYASKRAQKTMEAIQLISKRSAAAAFGTAKKGAKNKVRNFRVPMALPVK